MTQAMRPIFIIVVIAQILILGAMITGREYVLQTGQRIYLACEPIDPRSLFSGDYVILNYKISRLNAFLNVDLEPFRRHDKVYVALQPSPVPTDGTPESSPKIQTWNAIAISKSIEKVTKDNTVVMRGTITDTYYGTYRIRYGVEQYFVPQYQGKTIEHSLAKTVVELAVVPSGDSAILRLFLEGEEVKFY